MEGVVRSLIRTCLATVGLLLAAAAPASAHSLVRVENGQLRYISADTISRNNVVIRDTGASYRITDPTVDGGMDAGPCTPLQVNNAGDVIEVDCSKAGIQSVRVDIGEQNDTAKLQVALPAVVLGGPGDDGLETTAQNDVINGEDGNDTITAAGGDDTVTGGAGDDTIDGGDGKDIVHGGAGVDNVKGGPGDDDIRTRDDSADNVDCAAGTDTVTGDEHDAVPAEAGCETVNRTPGSGVANPDQPESTVVKADRVAPILRIGGAIAQRPLGRKRIVLLAAASESGTLKLACTVRVAGKRYSLKAQQVTIGVDGEGADVVFALPPKVVSAIRSALARSRGVTARLTVRASDRAGNISAPATRSIRLKR